MADHTIERTQRKLPSIPLLVGVFLISLLLSGATIFVILDQVIESPDSGDAYNDVLTSTYGEDGVRLIDPPREVTDFTLTSHTGSPLSLSDLRGKPVILFFGYTSCPDVCPMTMMDMQRVQGALGETDDEVSYLFVSVDGERDTPERLQRFFAMRNVEAFMHGMSGVDTTLRQITPDYGLFYQLNEPEANDYYTVDHTSSTFLLDAEGRLARIFAFGTEPDVIARHIRELL